MKVIYHCYGGAHSSVIAAAIQTGKLPEDRLPSALELLAVPYFDRPEEMDQGWLRLMGTDEGGREVYVVGKRRMGFVYERFLLGVAGVLGIPDGALMLVDTASCVNGMMRLGGYLSRRLLLTDLGRPIVLAGTRRAYFALASLVATVKVKLPGMEQEQGKRAGNW
jgi:hypothetical protein